MSGPGAEKVIEESRQAIDALHVLLDTLSGYVDELQEEVQHHDESRGDARQAE